MTHRKSAALSPLDFAAAQIAADHSAALYVVDKAILDLGTSPFCKEEVARARDTYFRDTGHLRRGRRLSLRLEHQQEVATAQAHLLAAVMVAARRQKSEMLITELDRLLRLAEGHKQNVRPAGTPQ
ncbi:hypothetical protein C882_0642 [Caenispirillum salinarum AK4]|uniref:Uncharacterized protein n=1 Tax=Caenispirillum salinarum AK4 TaxID=1238182 RepID=K9GVV1_9PROT|nr:hypothetical protein [Caenispirillum salinarum]EKV28879.1 hypothetical protein C882_0642 [Caenispirillum salinarum AK4]